MVPPARQPIHSKSFRTLKKNKPLPKGISFTASKASSKLVTHGRSKHAFTAKKPKIVEGDISAVEPHKSTKSELEASKTSKKVDKMPLKHSKDDLQVTKMKNTKSKSSPLEAKPKYGSTQKVSSVAKSSKAIKKSSAVASALSAKQFKKVAARDHQTPNLPVVEHQRKRSPSGPRVATNNQSHLDVATSKDHYSQYGSIPSGFKYFKNVVRDLQPVAQKLRTASQKLTENSLYAHSIMDRQEHMIADYIRQRGRVSKKEKLNVRRNLDKFSAELERVHSEDNRTCRESYNYVDVKIQKMDADLRAKRSIYEELAKESRLEVPNDLSVLNPKKAHKRKKNSMHANKKVAPNQMLLPNTMMLNTLPASDAAAGMTAAGIMVGGIAAQPANRLDPAMVKDMPIDPHEPLYCYCKQVSFGDMIACDNPECQTEWYHFACVGITRKPTGKWFCPTCVQQQAQQVSANDSAGLAAQ